MFIVRSKINKTKPINSSFLITNMFSEKSEIKSENKHLSNKDRDILYLRN